MQSDCRSRKRSLQCRRSWRPSVRCARGRKGNATRRPLPRRPPRAADGGQSCAANSGALTQRSTPTPPRAPSEGHAAGCCFRRFRDRGVVVARLEGEVPVESYRARGGSMTPRPTAATSRAITTIDTVSIVFTPNAPVRRDAGGAYSSSRGIAAVQYKQVTHAVVPRCSHGCSRHCDGWITSRPAARRRSTRCSAHTPAR